MNDNNNKGYKYTEWKTITIEQRNDYDYMVTVKDKYDNGLTVEERSGEYARDYKLISDTVYKMRQKRSKVVDAVVEEETTKVLQWKNISLEQRADYSFIVALKEKYESVLTEAEIAGAYARDYKLVSDALYKMNTEKQKLVEKAAELEAQLGDTKGMDIKDQIDLVNEKWCLDNIVFMPDDYYVIGDSEKFSNKGKMQDYYGDKRLVEVDENGRSKTTYVVDRIKDNADKMTASGFAWMPVANDEAMNHMVNMEGKNYINEYTPIHIKGVEGDVSKWLELVRFICGDYADMVLDHMAFTCQHPDKKIIWQILIYDSTKRNGKSSIFTPLTQLLGDKATSVNPELIEAGWGDVYAKHKVIVIEEIRGFDKASFNNIKTKFANDDIEMLNMKGGFIIRQANRYSMYLLSNHDDAIQMDLDEGKILAIKGPGRFIYGDELDEKSIKFYREYWNWLRTDIGKEAVAYYLMNRDVSKFAYDTPPPITDALRDVCENSAPSYENKMREMVEDNEKPFDKFGVKAEDLYEMLRGDYDVKSLKGIRKQLRQLGFVPVRGQKWAKDGNETVRYWAKKEDIEGLSASDLYKYVDTRATNLSSKNIKMFKNDKLLDMLD